MSDLRMELIQGQLQDIEENVRSISLKADRQKAINEAYQKGYDEAWASVGECEDRVAKQAYQKGLDDAWETIIKIALIPYAQRSEIFDGQQDILSIVQKFSPSEVAAKLREYERQKADAEIKVGDIITDGKINYLVIDITDKSYIALQGTDFEPSYIGKDYIKSYHNLHDSKDMRKIAEEINKAIKNEQRNCSTCKYIHNILMCNTCYDFNKWVQKEGAE